jgi:triosephosphate isomerase
MKNNKSKPILACNWKMNPVSLGEVSTLINQYLKIKNEYGGIELITFPPSIYLSYFANTNISFGSQDISQHLSGAFTSEISAPMLLDIKGRYTLIGHSETRQNLSFTDKNIAAKFILALKNNITPVLCIGYNEDKQSQDINLQQILDQILACVSQLEVVHSYESKFMIAYEPVWAIGSGKTPTNQMIFDTVQTIKKFLHESFALVDIPVLYGGSVNDKNIAELKQVSNLDGFLVGGASLNSKQITAIAQILNT